MTTLAQLQADLKTAQDELVKDQAALDVAKSKLALATTEVNNLQSEVANDQAAIKSLEDQIANYHPPSANTRFGFWADNMAQFDYGVGKYGKPDYYRSRGGEGELDDPMLLAPTLAKAKEGYLVSLQFQPKTGKGPQRTGVPYKDITAGKWDTTILKMFAELKALPAGYPPVIFEVHSEANIQHGNPDPQPTSGTAAEYPAFCRHIHDLAKKAGVRDKLLFTLSMTRGPWAGNEWLTWTKGLQDVLQMFAVDGYSRMAEGKSQTPQDIIAGVTKAARAWSIPWNICEFGCQESKTQPTAKAQWFKTFQALIQKEGHDCYSIHYNIGESFGPDSSASSLAAFRDFVASVTTA